MKILLTLPTADLGTSDFLRSGNIIHAPLLDTAPGGQLLDALLSHGATALITSHRPDGPTLRSWSRNAPGPTFLSYASGAPPRYPLDDTGPGLTELPATATAWRRSPPRWPTANGTRRSPAPPPARPPRRAGGRVRSSSSAPGSSTSSPRCTSPSTATG
ncbi:hypothetical protein ACFQ2B_33125 [Streptomyces stramineus]